MSERESICADIIDEGLVAIVRVPRTELALPLAKALVGGGIRAVELPMTIPNALDAIREIDRELGNDILLGVGTVIDDNTCRAAIDAGAKYVISPVTKPSLVEAAHALDRPVMLGAYTPTEAQTAHEAGSDFIKIFPADTLGPGYIKALLAPLTHLRIIPTGGVNLDTMESFLAAGSAALGIGSSLLKKDIIESENWPELERLAKQQPEVGAVFHAAAVSDFAAGAVLQKKDDGEFTPLRQGKVSTREGSLLLELRPTQKIISHLRGWFSNAQLVGWKYEVDGDRASALGQAGGEAVASCR